MRTKFPTTDIGEFSYFVVFNTGPECKRRLEYFHYTNLENLQYIMNDSCIDLRFTRADSFADEQEVWHIVPLFEDVCADLLGKGDIDIGFYNLVKSCISDTCECIKEFRKYFVFCLSANANSAYLKENYACRGGKDGAIIGIQALEFENLQFTMVGDREKPADGIYIRDVIYDRYELQNGFYEIVKQLYEMTSSNPESTKALKRTVNALITAYSLVYKPLPFAQEEETRVIVDLSRLTLPKDKYYQNDDHYLHILLPLDGLYQIERIRGK